MKSISTLPAFLLFLFSSVYLNAQITPASQWVWVKGDNTANAPGIYGTLGVEAASNKPGARGGECASWKDEAGNFWLFGGYAPNSALLNDLWKFNPTTNQWTWVNGANTPFQFGTYGTMGIAAPANRPGSRYQSVTWKDTTGNFWLFGGHGLAATNSPDFYANLNDLWKYNPVTNQWTWVNGAITNNQPGVYGTQGVPAAGNIPGARYGSTSWTDTAGNFWLFGGAVYSANGNNQFNDLWKYKPATNQWVWVNGANTFNQPSTYGTQGIPASANRPGEREGSVSWTDAANNLWLFGGIDHNSNSLNDLWRYNTATNEWTWMKGGNVINQTGVYGTKGVAATTNRPGARGGSITWTDNSGNFWLFGGAGYATSTFVSDYLNDLWKYEPALNQWTWINGANTTGQTSTYGTMGIPAATNKPGARAAGALWNDASDNLWLFGGAFDGGFLNDLWKLGTINFSFISANNGNWDSPSTWVGGVVPSANSVVTVRHNVTVQANANSYSLRIEGPNGNVTVATGIQFTVLH